MSLDPREGVFRGLVDRAMGELRAAHGVDPTGFQEGWESKVAAYLDEVIVWNRKVDLTAARSLGELVDLTLADAAVLSGVEAEGRWVDVGSGAGAPGLVTALLRPRVAVTLVEPRERRVAFLRTTASKLGASGVSVVRGRSEALAAAGWDVAISRATLPPVDWLREGARLATRSVWVLLARESAPSRPGWKAERTVGYAWPLTGARRSAVRYVPDPPPGNTTKKFDGREPTGEM